MGTVRMTMAQALCRYLAAQRTLVNGREVPLCAGVWAIFGHGNVAGLGHALSAMGAALPTYRGHNEQAMAHAATAFAKASHRRRFMAATTSIGPGATNLVTAAATAHVNRLPLLLLPGDVFASRFPDPVLQQLEDFGDATATVNDCLRPVSRYFDRLTRPEQLLAALPQAMRVLTDPVDCGPVTLALPQDVQTEAFDYPESFFTPQRRAPRRSGPDEAELQEAVALLRRARRPLCILGGGAIYSEAGEAVDRFARAHHVPLCETQAGKGLLPADHPWQQGGVGVTGSAAANALAAEADLILAVGTRLMDFTTASWSLFAPDAEILGLNVAPFDAIKRGRALVADARVGLELLAERLAGWQSESTWADRVATVASAWRATVAEVTAATDGLPTDAQVLGAVNRTFAANDVVVGAAGGLPGELHKLWQVPESGGYHLEYGYSCMGYELAAGLGVKLARPEANVFVLLGDGSYLMLNSELATAAALGVKLTVILLDNHGFGCINRLQKSVGAAPFGNLLAGADGAPPPIDFVAHARALGAASEKVGSIAELERALARARREPRSTVLVIETDPQRSTSQGGAWWAVAVPEVAEEVTVRAARERYVQQRQLQRIGKP